MLGYILSAGDGAVNLTLADLAVRLADSGVVVGGAVQTNIDRPDGRTSDMDLRVLPLGPVYRISQDLGPGSTGCRLDPAGLEAAVGAVAAQYQQVDLLILNRFGKHEAEGRGFRPVIGDALAMGVPVILALRPDFLPAFQTFTEGLGEPLPNDVDEIVSWVSNLGPAL